MKLAVKSVRMMEDRWNRGKSNVNRHGCSSVVPCKDESKEYANWERCCIFEARNEWNVLCVSVAHSRNVKPS